VTKLIDAFRNFAKALNNYGVLNSKLTNIRKEALIDGIECISHCVLQLLFETVSDVVFNRLKTKRICFI
jgi:hypothetical protein